LTNLQSEIIEAIRRLFHDSFFSFLQTVKKRFS